MRLHVIILEFNYGNESGRRTRAVPAGRIANVFPIARVHDQTIGFSKSLGQERSRRQTYVFFLYLLIVIGRSPSDRGKR